jgi:hypothetical protein
VKDCNLAHTMPDINVYARAHVLHFFRPVVAITTTNGETLQEHDHYGVRRVL